MLLYYGPARIWWAAQSGLGYLNPRRVGGRGRVLLLLKWQSVQVNVLVSHPFFFVGWPSVIWITERSCHFLSFGSFRQPIRAMNPSGRSPFPRDDLTFFLVVTFKNFSGFLKKMSRRIFFDWSELMCLIPPFLGYLPVPHFCSLFARIFFITRKWTDSLDEDRPLWRRLLYRIGDQQLLWALPFHRLPNRISTTRHLEPKIADLNHFYLQGPQNVEYATVQYFPQFY